MKKLPFYLLIATITFLIGWAFASFWFAPTSQVIPNDIQDAGVIDDIPEAQHEKEDLGAKQPDIIWLDEQKFSYEGYQVKREYVPKKDPETPYKLLISRNGKTLAKFDSWEERWIEYGLFDFLGKGSKQLIIHTYSGGAHCCDDFFIYDLNPSFRIVYDSTRYDSGSEIGEYLTPIDIDGDGVFEFRQSVMAFDYFYESHAGSIFPPALFAYNPKKRRYEIANKKFPDFVLKELARLEKYEEPWYEEADGKLEKQHYDARLRFLYLIYAGHKDEAWTYFDDNYKKEDKEEYRKDIKEIFAEEPTYKSIYADSKY